MGYKILFIGALSGLFLEFAVATYAQMRFINIPLLAASACLFGIGLYWAKRVPK